MFPSSIVWNPWVPKRVSFFCLGSYLEENSDYGSTKKEGWVSFYWPGSFCVKWKKNQQIICLFIVPRQPWFGTLFLLFLVFSGLCPILSRKSSLVGTASLLGRKEKMHGMQPLYVYFGHYGRRETEEPLKIPN